MHPLVLLALVFALRSGSGGNRYLWQPTGLLWKNGATGRFPGLPEFPTYFDTFRMELMLDRMRTLTEALDKVNHLRQLNQQASGSQGSSTPGFGGSGQPGREGVGGKAELGLAGLLTDFPDKMERISESLDVAKAFLADTKAGRRADQLSGVVEALRQVGDPSALGNVLQRMGDPAALMEAAGPLLAGLGGLNTTAEKRDGT